MGRRCIVRSCRSAVSLRRRGSVRLLRRGIIVRLLGRCVIRLLGRSSVCRLSAAIARCSVGLLRSTIGRLCDVVSLRRVSSGGRCGVISLWRVRIRCVSVCWLLVIGHLRLDEMVKRREDARRRCDLYHRQGERIQADSLHVSLIRLCVT